MYINFYLTCTFIYEMHKQCIDDKSIVERTELKLTVWLFPLVIVNEEIFSSFVCKEIVKMLCMTRLPINVFWVLIFGLYSFLYFPILQHGKGAWLLSNSIDYLLVFLLSLTIFSLMLSTFTQGDSSRGGTRCLSSLRFTGGQ